MAKSVLSVTVYTEIQGILHGGWTDGWMDGQVDGQVDRWMDGCHWMDRWIDGWMDGQVDRWMDEWIGGYCIMPYTSTERKGTTSRRTMVQSQEESFIILNTD